MAKKKSAQGRSFIFSFSPAGLFAMLLFTIIALAWAFIFGLFLGRGYQPEELVPEIAQIMPTPPPPPNVTETLRPEDLNFYEQLKNMPLKEEPAGANTKARLSSRQEKSSSMASKKKQQRVSDTKKKKHQKQPAANSKSGTQQRQTKQAVQPKRTKKKTPQQARQDKKIRFSYRYQIAALKDGAAALSVQKKLEAKGIKASIAKTSIKGTNWYRIFVQVLGNDQDVQTTAAKLKKMGFPDMIFTNKSRLD